jgi:hypothetical protein
MRPARDRGHWWDVACDEWRPEAAVATTDQDTIEWLLARHGRTFAEELGIDIEANTPAPLFRLLVMSLLLSARISHEIGMRTARAMFDGGWTTAEKLARSTWEERVKVINAAGYARYDERTSRMLGDDAHLLLDRYGGDLRRLRDSAEKDPARERSLLKEIKGIGDVGCDIFFREVQLAWNELYPFADERALHGAHRLGLPATPEALAETVPRHTFPRLVSALVRAELTGETRTA